jgi:hypothetical protein
MFANENAGHSREKIVADQLVYHWKPFFQGIGQANCNVVAIDSKAFGGRFALRIESIPQVLLRLDQATPA